MKDRLAKLENARDLMTTYADGIIDETDVTFPDFPWRERASAAATILMEMAKDAAEMLPDPFEQETALRVFHDAIENRLQAWRDRQVA